MLPEGGQNSDVLALDMSRDENESEINDGDGDSDLASLKGIIQQSHGAPCIPMAHA